MFGLTLRPSCKLLLRTELYFNSLLDLVAIAAASRNGKAEDGSYREVKEAEERKQQRRLAATRPPNNPDLFPMADGQVHPVERQVSVGSVAHAHALKHH